MTAATKEQLAAKLAQAIYEEIASPLFRARRARVAGLPQPPDHAGDDRRPARRLARASASPPGYAARGRRRDARAAAPAPGGARRPSASGARASSSTSSRRCSSSTRPCRALMRAVFQTQPDVAHVYLGSKRSMMHGLFNDANEPFWRSAKHDGARRDRARRLRPRSSASASRPTGRRIGTRRSSTGCSRSRAATPTRRRSSATRLWEETAARRPARAASSSMRRSTACSGPENAHFTLIWDHASRVQRAAAPGARRRAARLGDERGVPPAATACRARSSVQRALDALVGRRARASGRAAGAYRIGEPFLAEWILRLSGLKQALGVLAHEAQHGAPVPERPAREEASGR